MSNKVSKGKMWCHFFVGLFVFSFVQIADAQHLFDVAKKDLSDAQIEKIHSNSLILKAKEQYVNKGRIKISVPVDVKKNCGIVLVNEKTGRHVVLSGFSAKISDAEITPLLLAELKQSVLGDADEYTCSVVEDVSANTPVVCVTKRISASIDGVKLPVFKYGRRGDIKTANIGDRKLVNVFRKKPQFIPANPNDPVLQERIEALGEANAYYAYTYAFPDGSQCTYDQKLDMEAAGGIVQNVIVGGALPFDISFIGLTDQQKTASQYGAGLWGAKLSGSVPVSVNISFTTLGDGILGCSYSPDAYLIGEVYYPSALANQMSGTDLAASVTDIQLEFNTQYAYYFGMDMAGGSSTDYVTVLLHEMAHGLGFYDSIVSATGGYGYGNGAYPLIYDTFLFYSGNFLTTLSNSGRYTAIRSNALYFNGPNAKAANNGNQIKLYAPSTYKPGSSVSHWDTDVTFSTFMKYAYTYPLHTIGARKLGLMKDLGWSLATDTAAPPSAPAGVAASDDTYTDKVRITWSASSAATSYLIYRSTSGSSSSSSQVGTSMTSPYDDTTAAAGTTYYYWVKASNTYGTSDFSNADSGKMAIPTVPDAPSVNCGYYSGTQLYLYWNAVAGASYYKIYRATSPFDTPSALTSWQTDTQYVMTKPPAGTIYFYWVKAAPTASDTYASVFSNMRYDSLGDIAVYTINFDGGEIDSYATTYGYLGTERVTFAPSLPLPSWVTPLLVAGTTTYSLDQTRTLTFSSPTAVSYQITCAANSTTSTRFWMVAETVVDITYGGTYSSTNYFYQAPGEVSVPSAPTGVSADDGASTSGVGISWADSSGATSYSVYRSTLSNPSLASLLGSTSSTSYTDTGAMSGVLYYYWVKASNSAGTSGFSSLDTGYCALCAPWNVSATDTATDAVTVTWGSVTGASYYRVYRATSSGGTKTALGSWQTALSYSDTSAATGTTYYYWVVAAVDSSGTRTSAYSLYDTGVRPALSVPSEPTGVSASDGSSIASVNVSWMASSGASIYYVYRYTSSSSSSASLLGGTSGTSYVDTGAMSGVLYYYWVKASNSAGTSGFSSSDTGYRALPAPAGVSATDASPDAVTVTWGSVTGASHYRVYRATTSTGTKTALGSWQTSCSYSDTSATAGTTYYYWVVAAMDSSGTRPSGYSAYDTGVRMVSVALGTALDNSSLTWTTGGYANWFGQTSTTHDGVDAAQIGDIGDSQTNWLQTTVTGPGTLSFWWQVSSEQNCDYLKFSLDGTNLWSMSGTSNWTQRTASVIGSGVHTLKWTYSKDSSVSSGSDCGWVDQVVWTATTSDFGYAISNGCVTITNYTGSSLSVSIPTLIEGYPVTGIGNKAFYGRTDLMSVTIPSGVMSIGDYAFCNCSVLTNVEVGVSVTNIGNWAFGFCDRLRTVKIPDSATYVGDGAFWRCGGLTTVVIGSGVTSIGAGAFANCYGLTSVAIPDSVTQVLNSAFYYCVGLTNAVIGAGVKGIGDAVFYRCSSLISIQVAAANSAYAGLDGVLFDKFATTLIRCPAMKNGIYQIPLSVTNIGELAFESCASLMSVRIPDSVTSIGREAFDSCTSLTSIKIPDSVTNLGECTFFSCTSLTNAVVGKGVSDIRERTFANCTALTLVTLPDSVTSIGDWTFDSCICLNSVTLPHSVTSIGDGVFYRCSSLASIVIHGGVTSIGASAFQETGLVSVAIPNSVTSIGNFALTDCPSLTNVVIGENVTSLGDNVFAGCYSLTAVTIPSKVTSIGGYAFYGCTGLTNVVIGAGVTALEASVFGGCTNLACVTLFNDLTNFGAGWAFADSTRLATIIVGAGVTNIGEYAFSNCAGLLSVTIPDSVTSIGGGAFYNCTALTNIVMGASVTSIGDWAFYNCTALMNIVMGSSVTNIGACAFSDCIGLTNAVIGTSLTSIAEGMFNNCCGLVSVKIPDNVSSIGYGAFYNCSGLTEVMIGSGVTIIGEWAFYNCCNLCHIFFKGDAPGVTDSMFVQTHATALYVLGKSGWETSYDTLITAVWTAEATFDAGEGTPSYASKTYNVGNVYGELPTATRPGYSFAGWHATTNGSDTFVTTHSVVPYVTTNYTLYAAWSAVQQQVATPVISPTNGTVFTTSSKRVTITCATSGSEIRFTTNGVDPTASSDMYTSSFNIYATTTVKARAFKSGMTDSELAMATITKPLTITLADALDVPSWTVTTGGNALWTPQTTMTHDASDAVRTGTIGTSQSTWLETSVTGAGMLTFWWRASCEDSPDDDWDFLTFTVDGVERSRIDGESGWQQVSVALSAGTHMLRWTYAKDDYDEIVNSDCGWVDQMVWTPFGGSTTTTDVPVPYSWLDQFGLVSGGDYEAAALADADGDGHLTWQEYVAGSDPANRTSAFRAMIAVSNGLPRITWSPDLRPDRIYTVLGKTNLTDAAWGPTNAASRFFKIKVEMP